METHAGIAAHTGQAGGGKKGDSIKSVKQMHSCTILFGAKGHCLS